MWPLKMSTSSLGQKILVPKITQNMKKYSCFTYAHFHATPRKNYHFKFRQIKNVTECPIRRVEKYPKGEYEIDHFVLNDEVVMVS